MVLSFAFQTVLPFIISACVVVGITVLAERLGTRVGGIVGTLPSTIVISYVFIALNKGAVFAADAVEMVPAVMGLNVLFLCFFAVLVRWSKWLAIIGSLGAWAILSYGVYIMANLGMLSIGLSLIMMLCCWSLSFGVLEFGFKFGSVGGVKMEYGWKKIVFRGLLAGTVVAIAVALSNVGSVLSGMFSAFPVIFLSTMLIAVREHDAAFVRGIAKSLVFGSWSVASYAVALYYLYPALGVEVGTVVCFVVGCCVSYVLYACRAFIR